ncbi:pyridoxal 5'-phosphate synthase glutaminase subunit PdxT [Carnimonas nigrificans]|uniref:pyridoxal 5'-phosphate synthase glutaminase subunit PdxT n=1 Tax=Carnimonas nigrificans TaxID=64323 RepID=UPI000471B272|nr:pyridoxal 5'-phosphate synthase glutaminase subunit PdxT [Carnimonas nigrificans]
MAMRVGVLAVQGAYQAHAARLKLLGAEPVLVRSAAELNDIRGIILPGGESTTMLRFLARDQLLQALTDFAAEHPVLGTCAGLILLAREVEPQQQSLGLLNVSVQRNAYGRQLDSAIIKGSTALSGGPLEMVFIRAPAITHVGDGVTVLAERDNQPVLVQQGHLLGCAFHPELSQDTRVHQLFLEGMGRGI